ncbi:hypothetical protein [Clostridium estertheticum]|uniref:Uncharacterized protein n=1 Tax=Clostridium estertheticum TaxID=238834 RepID=A0A7Y3SX82_9CLOT|nr:hypothetical protein [Clostridium estertheticum]MBW9171802.1 hypothetical protein [Clostridium estertheticum]MBX4270383.1 hypothetical protein [Clostridium estertheticum]NNU77031.1 hypothetical protein [Clostridium estertheticum]WBL47880.1 hypothetical protein LOR37_04225 [Clostridium estertheticum]WLC75973.1 hypothetical protein KTC99_03855 [Clostridium estertheticum]
MDILYVCNEKMKRSYILEAVFNKICIINKIVPQVKNILFSLKQISSSKNNVYLLFDKIWKIVAFE